MPPYKGYDRRPFRTLDRKHDPILMQNNIQQAHNKTELVQSL